VISFGAMRFGTITDEKTLLAILDAAGHTPIPLLTLRRLRLLVAGRILPLNTH
jgi:hypothetical protein